MRNETSELCKESGHMQIMAVEYTHFVKELSATFHPLLSFITLIHNLLLQTEIHCCKDNHN
jgi:hypothetical protein